MRAIHPAPRCPPPFSPAKTAQISQPENRETRDARDVNANTNSMTTTRRASNHRTSPWINRMNSCTRFYAKIPNTTNTLTGTETHSCWPRQVLQVHTHTHVITLTEPAGQRLVATAATVATTKITHTRMPKTNTLDRLINTINVPNWRNYCYSSGTQTHTNTLHARGSRWRPLAALVCAGHRHKIAIIKRQLLKRVCTPRACVGTRCERIIQMALDACPRTRRTTFISRIPRSTGICIN